MNNSKPIRRLVVLALASTLVLAVSARAQEMTRYRARPIGSTVRIDGAANVHDWTMEGSLIGGFLEVPAGVVLDSAQADIAGAPDGKVKAKVEVTIRVSSVKNIHSYEGMDEVMQNAMDAADHPWIKYTTSELVLKQPHAAGTPLQFDTTGELSFNGVTNKMSVPVTIETVDKTKLKITGAAIPVSMTDFKVKPPVKFGVFETKPEVKISFDWIVGAAAKTEGK